ncbi:glycosyltransferase [Neorhizobium galegae]|nr:glycosyltransferase [Neorhizobium galegae]
MREARLTIVGEGDERGNLEALIEALNLSQDVSLPGHNPDPLSILSQASLFVSSSSHEGLGNALIEAMACGVPVVATDAPYGPREILQGGRLGRLVPVGDATALAQAMAMTLEQPPESAVLRPAPPRNSASRHRPKGSSIFFRRQGSREMPFLRRRRLRQL